MKKQYMTPELVIVKINVCQLMAGSALGSGVSEEFLDEGVDGLSREFDVEEDLELDEEDDYDLDE